MNSSSPHGPGRLRTWADTLGWAGLGGKRSVPSRTLRQTAAGKGSVALGDPLTPPLFDLRAQTAHTWEFTFLVYSSRGQGGIMNEKF